MLKKIPSIISPELIKILMEMGHGDEIVLADGNFPSASIGQRVVRLDGHGGPEILMAILKLFPLDPYVESPVILMQTTESDKDLKPEIWQEYRDIVTSFSKREIKFNYLERFKFYQRARKAYAVVASSETSLYANLILKKGVIAKEPV
ncbi:RbsD/FucU family protein [Halanaerobium salsuginis]|uniref:L-fucose mutarotase n=1 Tax=Halanaerobium salsuginis TaxID=29563 RepID=A0A1I4JJC5_9FIRM|nr:RbsD/FucU domain-containing protein [Halanaerobium salsuginis]SFL66206.1 L-fucose mutarotase [Halanaerobium salsuginis]